MAPLAAGTQPPAAAKIRRYHDGAVAQLGERYNGIVEVVGSIPSGSTNNFRRGTRSRTRPVSAGSLLHFRATPVRATPGGPIDKPSRPALF